MRLTDNDVKKLAPPARGNKVSYDAEVKGFGIRVTAAGSRAFILNYRRKSDGRERRITIGSFPDWSTSAARGEAKRLKREVDIGADPVGEQQASRNAVTIADLCARFEQEYLSRKRASTQRDYRQQIAADILPAIGGLKVAAVSYADIDSLHRRITARAPTHANRVVALLSRMFSLAIRWEMRADNPCRGVERNQENRRQRYLSGAELARLSEALTGFRDQGAANAVRLLLLTGARRGEVLAARWSDIDLINRRWIKPGSTTKRKTVHDVPLSEAACQLLGEMKDQGGDDVWLFPPPERRTPYRRDIDDAWAALCEAAVLSNAHLHDLRHTYASVLVSSGLSLPIIGALLGHSTAQTTMRYSHIMDDPLRAATERASAVLSGKNPIQSVPLERRGRR
jgi:integrase